MLSARRLLLATLTGAVLVAGTGCAGLRSHPVPADAPAVRYATAAPATVALASATHPAARAAEVSRSLFAASPGAVLAPASDPAAQRTGAREARRLHVPLLLTPGAAPELDRLGARWAEPVGGAVVPAGLRSVTGSMPSPARPRPVGAVVVLAHPAADPAAAATAEAAGATVVSAADVTRSPAAIAALSAHPAAPALLVGAAPSPSVHWAVRAARSGWQLPGGGQRHFPGHRFVALYGVPGVPVLGALGDQGVAATIARVQRLAKQYGPLSAEPVVPTLEIIATVAAGAAGSDGDYSNELPVAELEPYVAAAERSHVSVILDLQPGRSDFLPQAKRYASLLQHPNVGLALDPEWRLGPHQLPLKQIGAVRAAEVNRVSAWLADLVERRGLPPKLFVLHQFRRSMLPDRAAIVQRPELDLLIHVDGQGGQPDKQATWRAVRAGAPGSIGWGWKNFLHKDRPMLTPAQTMTQVRPQPDLITYQ